MSGSERSGGFYTMEMLRGGMRDQYAVQRSYGTVVIELYINGSGPIITERITEADGTYSFTAWSFDFLGDAHREYKRLVKKHP